MNESKMKTCTTCKKEKELLCFIGNKGQETKMCDRCLNMSKKVKEHNKNKHMSNVTEPNKKICVRCYKEKDKSCFVRKGGLETKKCDECRDRYNKTKNENIKKRMCNTTDPNIKTCTRCKKGKDKSCFVSKRKKETTQCNECRIYCKASSDKNKCEHNRKRHICKECKGVSVCEHNEVKYNCKMCDGSAICEHDIRRTLCKKCDGGGICEHDRRRSRCKQCEGGEICEHDKYRTHCRECRGGSICHHSKTRSRCKICHPLGYLVHIVRSRVRHALKSNKTKKSVEYLGCTIEEYKKFLEDKFVEGMTWENRNEWHIDHIIPLQYENPTIEEVVERLHYTNTQPLWKEENLSKGNRYIG